jgi:hypothetical protein
MNVTKPYKCIRFGIRFGAMDVTNLINALPPRGWNPPNRDTKKQHYQNRPTGGDNPHATYRR